MAYSDLELLARIVECEAGGEGETGMKAVASVVMNRVQVDYGEYGRLYTIREVVYQRGQFTCAMETVGGVYNMQNIYNMRPTQVHYDIANWAIAGNRLTNLGFALWFYNPFSVTCRDNFPSRVGEFVIRIGDHCFYNPTPAYAETEGGSAMPERRMNQPETAHSQMNRLRNRSDFSEGADGSRSLDNFNTPPQPSFDSEEMRGSMQAILAQNIGEYVVIEFLIGTENIVRKQGMLYFVGRSFVTLYDENVNNFIVCDIFSVKFVYFYMPGDRPRYNYNLLPPISGEPGMNARLR